MAIISKVKSHSQSQLAYDKMPSAGRFARDGVSHSADFEFCPTLQSLSVGSRHGCSFHWNWKNPSSSQLYQARKAYLLLLLSFQTQWIKKCQKPYLLLLFSFCFDPFQPLQLKGSRVKHLSPNASVPIGIYLLLLIIVWKKASLFIMFCFWSSLLQYSRISSSWVHC